MNLKFDSSITFCSRHEACQIPRQRIWKKFEEIFDCDEISTNWGDLSEFVAPSTDQRGRSKQKQLTH
jgi:hypothetical protein